MTDQVEANRKQHRQSCETPADRNVRRDTFGLLEIADDAHRTLQSFNAAQNRFSAFRGGAFLQAEPAISAVAECVEQLESGMTNLEATIPRLTNRPEAIAEVETDFCQALGTYLCNLINSMNAYLHFLRVHRATIPQFVLVRAWHRWQAESAFNRYESKRMQSGSDLMMAYNAYNIAQAG